jgi:hypothetical protein
MYKICYFYQSKLFLELLSHDEYFYAPFLYYAHAYMIYNPIIPSHDSSQQSWNLIFLECKVEFFFFVSFFLFTYSYEAELNFPRNHKMTSYSRVIKN